MQRILTRGGLALLAVSLLISSPARAGENLTKLELKDGSVKIANLLTNTDSKDKKQTRSYSKLYSVELKGGKTYQIDMMSPDKKLDPYLRLEDPAGKELATDDDSGEGLNARILFVAPKDGAYRIIATTFVGGVGPFELLVSEYGKTSAIQAPNATKLTLQDGVAKISAALTDKDTRDTKLPKNICKTYAIDLKGGQTYQIDMVRTDNDKDKFFDPYLRLEDPTGAEVAKDDDGGGFPNARIIYAVPKDGTYLVVATSVGAPGAYELTVKQMAAAKALALVLAGGEATETSELSKADPTDKVRKSSPAKVYTIALKKNKSYQIDMMSNRIDSFLRLEDPAGRQLADDDDSGDGLNARIIFGCTEDGEYRIIATTFAGGTGPFTLTVKEK